MFTILNLMKGWLLSSKREDLTSKELLVLMQRLAQLDRLHAIPPALKSSWDKTFLDLLYTVITTKAADFGQEVVNRVERTISCGLQSSDPATRQKVRRLGFA